MTDEEIHNIYLHMSGKAEGLVEATGTADFPVLFARAILEYEGLTKDVQNMASESTYKEQLETKDEPVAWMNRHGACKTSLFREMEAGAKEEYTIPVYTQPQRTWVGLTELDCVGWFGYDTGLRLWFEADKNDDGAIPLYKDQQQRTWVGLTDEEIQECLQGLPTQTIDVYARRIEAKLKDKNNG